METITTTTILDRGVKYLTNHPDALAKRTALAQVLVDGRVVRSIEAGVLLFKIWAQDNRGDLPLEALIDLANEKAKE